MSDETATTGEDEEKTTVYVEVQDNREPYISAADTFITTFIHTIHMWVVAAFWLLLLGGLLTLIGIL